MQAKFKYFSNDQIISYFTNDYSRFSTTVKLKLFDSTSINQFLNIYKEAYMAIFNIVQNNETFGFITKEHLEFKFTNTSDLSRFSYFIGSEDVLSKMIQLDVKGKQEIFNEIKYPLLAFQYFLMRYEKYQNNNELTSNMKAIDLLVNKAINKSRSVDTHLPEGRRFLLCSKTY